jgi:hypothetical protein
MRESPWADFFLVDDSGLFVISIGEAVLPKYNWAAKPYFKNS